MPGRSKPTFRFDVCSVFHVHIGTPSKAMAPRELSFSGRKHEDVKGFFFKYELVEMSEKTDDEKSMSLVSYLEGEALQFYLEMFTEGSQVTEDGKIYSNVKSKITAKYSKEKSDAEIIQDAVDLKYSGSDVQAFFRKAEKLYQKAGFGEKAQYGMILKAIKTNKKMLDFVLVRGDESFEMVKESCLQYEKKQNVH